MPTKEFQGKIGLGDYGDFVMETEGAVGQVLAALDEAAVAENTLVIFTSDNGCAPYIDVAELEAKGHYPSAGFRGYKIDIWDGGHRIPFIVRLPGRVRKRAGLCNQLVGLTDLIATCADVLGDKLPENAGDDSVSLLPALLGKSGAPLHEAIVNHSTRGFFATREGDWKLELCSGSGGWAKPSEEELQKSGESVQLYDMKTDWGERENLQAENPQIVERLLKILEQYVAAGRSTPGLPQRNNAPVDIWKTSHPGHDLP